MQESDVSFGYKCDGESNSCFFGHESDGEKRVVTLRLVAAREYFGFALLSCAAALILISVGIMQPAFSESKSRVEIIEVQPATTYYTTTVRKVPNTTKYPRYAPPQVQHNIVGHEVRIKTPTTLSGGVGQVDDLDDGINRGVGPVADALLKQAPQIGNVKHVHLSSDVFRFWMQKNWSKLLVTDLRPQYTVVVKGRYDHAEHILDSCRIPYMTADNSNLKARLAQATLLVINCPGELSDSSIDLVRQFVDSGGSLLTTDWSLSGCLEKICPGYVYWDGAYSKSEVVNGVVVLPENNLVGGAVSPAPWKLDDKSELIKPGARKSVQILARSRQLSFEDTVNLGVLALTFDFGKGRVLHLIGHIDNNTDLASQSVLPDPSPQSTISLRQVISLNFIMNALSHRN